MPIKGLTEKRRLPRIGKIHLGVKVKPEGGKNEYPKAVDYFVFDIEHPQYTELVTIYGEQPKELRVIFPVDDPEQFASQYYRMYSMTRGLTCKGDGEKAIRMVDTKTGAVADRNSKEVVNKEIACDGRDCPQYGRQGCGEVMNLQFLLPEVSGFGVWQIDSGSINSIRNINNALDLVKQIYGRISMVPLILTLEPIQVTNPDDGKKKTVRVLNIRSQDKMIDSYKKALMPPLELVSGMVDRDLVNGEITDLPTADDQPPYADLPIVSGESPAASNEDVNGSNLNDGAVNILTPATDARIPSLLWPDDGITTLSNDDPLPMGKHGDKIRIVQTGEILFWHQFDEKSGNWR